MIWRAAALRSSGVETINAWPPVHVARSSSVPVSAARSRRHRRNVGRGIVDRRHDADDVHPARRSRWRRPTPHSGFNRLELSLPSVKTMTARRQPSRAADRWAVAAIASLQRRRAERLDRRQPSGQRLQSGGERLDFVEVRVEGEDGGLVAARLERGQHLRRGFARVSKPRFHASTHVEEQRNTHAGEIVTKVGNRPRFAVVKNREVARRKVRHQSPFTIADDRVHAHQINAGVEGRRLCRRRRRRTGRRSRTRAAPMMRLPRFIAMGRHPKRLPGSQLHDYVRLNRI